jgi:hypothetical protein
VGRAIARAPGGAFGRAPDCAPRRAPIGATARQLRAPETLDGCTDYWRPLDASHRLDGERLLNRLTPPG